MSQSDDAQKLQPLVGHALLSGLCPLIPVPFVDDWVRDVIRKRMVRQLLASSNLQELDAERSKVLACGYDPATASGCLQKVVIWPFKFLFKLIVKKILRKIIFVLALKDCVDTFSATFHEGFLLRHALCKPETCRHSLSLDADFARVVELRRHIEGVRDEVDHRPVERWVRNSFQGSRKMLRKTARLVGRHLRALRRQGNLNDDEIYDEMRREQDGLGNMVDRLTEKISAETGYLEDLQRRLDQRLGVSEQHEA